MKLCSKCLVSKKPTEFYKRRSGVRKGEYYEKCKECYKERGRKYYHLNHERQLRLALLRKRKYIEERKKWLEQIKNKPCLDCGKIYPPWVMDFDHREGEAKIGSVSYLTFRNTSTFKKLTIEIAKCDLVCSNCHRQRTYQRLQDKFSAEIANEVKAPL